MLPPPKTFNDRELTIEAISLTFQRAHAVQRRLSGRSAHNGSGIEVETDPAPLPNPIVTDTNLRHYLEQATACRGVSIESGSERSRLTAALRHNRDQSRYNAAMIHVAHQLDHRTKLQQQVIARLEAEVAELQRALAALEPSQTGAADAW